MTPAVPADPSLVPGAGAPSGTGPRSGGRRRRKVPVFAVVVLAVAAVYFVGPILAAFWFTIHSNGGFDLHAYTGFWQADGFAEAFTQSLLLALAAVVVTIVLMVPTVVLIKLKLPRAKSLVETLSLIPLVVPPVALVVGVRGLISWTGTDAVASSPFGRFFDILQGDPPWLLALVYVVMAMPFTYRALDAGVQGADLPTLTEASRNLGASWWQTLRHVVAPALRTGILNAALLTFALVLGEYTIAKILSFTTFPVWLSQFGSTDGQLQVALSLMSLLVIWLLLLLVTFVGGRSPRAPRSARRKATS